MVNILVFKMGATCFGIETVHVKSITKNPELIKDKPSPVFANGHVDSVFSDKKIDACRETEFIVASFEGNELVMPIDEIVDIFQVLEKDIMPIPAFAVRHMSRDLFKGVVVVNDKLVLIINVSKFFIRR